ncbi:unnamed protein product [Cuscuta epithymum]|uniref:Uncharacterized protein n=1 Tax=Cuscuta epithymum TaxID=186058 RepID=A0AAV0GD80_9ASTE|nr:unnamed protein product [Cuscuta epithymum]
MSHSPASHQGRFEISINSFLEVQAQPKRTIVDSQTRRSMDTPKGEASLVATSRQLGFVPLSQG